MVGKISIKERMFPILLIIGGIIISIYLIFLKGCKIFGTSSGGEFLGDCGTVIDIIVVLMTIIIFSFIFYVINRNKKLRINQNKKAQLKIQQMAFMLIAVTLLFVLVGIFFLSMRLYNLKKTANMLEGENAMLLVSKLANSPEFSCGNSFGTSKANCVDEDKIMALKEKILDYYNFWGVAKIEVRKIHPEEEVITVYEKNVNMLPAVSNFISLCRKENSENGIYDKCVLGRLMIYSEDKG